MKTLFFVDLHGRLETLDSIASRVKKEKVDLLVCAGDMTTFENGLDTVLSRMNEIGVPVLLVHGNHETEENVALLCDMFDNLTFIHGKAAEFKGVLFMGWGGGGFSSEDKAFRKAAKQFRKAMKKGKTSVLVLHSPPANTLLGEIDGENAGNDDYRRFIDEMQPSIVICGHLHENAGMEDYVVTSRIINPGPKGLILDL